MVVISHYFASILGLIKVSASFAPKIFTVIFFLFLFCYEAASDSISDQFGQMTRQQQLEQQTKNRDAAWKEELRKELDADINTVNAIHNYFNRLN